MKTFLRAAIIVIAVIVPTARIAKAGDGKDEKQFKPNTLVVSCSVYEGDSSTATLDQILPPDCVCGVVQVAVLPGFIAQNGGSDTTNVTVACAVAKGDGTYPGVFANAGPDGSFGVTSPIFLDNITTDGKLLNTLAVDSSRIVTSFSSKSELALNRSLDRRSITFMGYVGGPKFVTGPNQLDVSNSNTPGVIDITNPVTSQYYRSVAEVDAWGRIDITDGNAYSGNNGRAAIKADGSTTRPATTTTAGSPHRTSMAYRRLTNWTALKTE